MEVKNVYIIGRVQGSYRTQNLIKFLLDQNYLIYFNSYKSGIFFGKKGLKRFFRLIIRGGEELLKRLFSLYSLMVSDLVILPAMCNSFQLELFLAKIFKKKIISEFYISKYDSVVLDNKEISLQSQKARKLLKNDFNVINLANIVLFLNTTEARRYLKLVNIPFDCLKHIVVPLVIEENIKCKLHYFYSNKIGEQKFNICWWGSYIPLHGLDNIIDACEILNKEYDLDFHLYLFGVNDGKGDKYKDKIKKLNLTSFITIDNTCTFKNGKLGGFIKNNCDLVLGNFGESEKAKNVLPNKLIDGVAMKAPVLTGESIAPHEFFNENEIFYSRNKPSFIAEKMYYISQCPKNEIISRLDKAYNVYEEVFSVSAYTKNMKEVLKKIES